MMADSPAQNVRSLNPWLLHLQKLGLELKCPLCLNFLNRPILLPCDHIFCNSCLPESALGCECPVCKALYFDKDRRHVPFIENMVTIYKGLDAAFCANLSQHSPPGTARVVENFPASRSMDSKKKFKKHLPKPIQKDNSSEVPSTESQLSKELGRFPSSHPVENTAEKVDMKNKCSVPIKIKDNEYGMVGNRGSGCTNEQNASSPAANAQQLQECGSAQIDMNQVDLLSPGSPPSFGDIKGSENDSNDQTVDDSPTHYHSSKLVKRNAGDGMTQKRHDSSASETEEGHLRDSKRHKMFNYTQSALCANSGHVEPNASQELESVVANADDKPLASLEDLSASNTICDFCQSSRISQKTGPMLHYVNGKSVPGNQGATISNAIHVHSTCIEWAPQVYYDGDIVKNLNTEVTRGAKLKCSKCGLKGAALGCYIKSCRRSYHSPCAMEITKCRWDNDKFLLLCPSHSSLKFPSEKTKSGKRNLSRVSAPTQIGPEQSNFWAGPSNLAKEWVLCGSALSPEEKALLAEFGSLIGVPVTRLWRADVTHVIASTDSDGACTRTLKFLMAVLNGKWVLTIDWIKACMESMQPVDEGPYEVSLDNHGCRGGPKFGRLRVLNNAPKLFSGLKFYFSGDFQSGYKEDLQDLVINAGGTILPSVDQNWDNAAPLSTLIVYNLDPPQGCKLGEEVEIIWQRLNEAQDLAAKLGSQVIGHTWILESIAAYSLRPVVS